MKRRALFGGAAVIASIPLSSAAAAIPCPVSDFGAEEAFALAFEKAPRLTWEWNGGFRLAGKPVSDEVANKWDGVLAWDARERGKAEFQQSLKDEFRSHYPRVHVAVNGFDDEVGYRAWEIEADRERDAWLRFEGEKHAAGLLPDWYVREFIS